MAYGVVGVSTPTILHAQSVQGSIPQTADTLNEAPLTDTTASVQMERRADQRSLDPSTDADINRRFNELRSELLDDRASTINWWLAIVALVLTFFAVVVAIVGVLGFKEFREIKREARAAIKEVEENAKETQRLKKEAEKNVDKIGEKLRNLDAENAANDPNAEKEAEAVSNDPEASPTDKAIARAISLQKEGEIEKAIKIWRGIAYSNEEIDNDLAARAWFSVSYLEGVGEDGNLEGILLACDKAIRLKPDFTEAYYNRGIAKEGLGRYQDAIADFDEAIHLKSDFAEAYHGRGIAKAGLGQHQDAIADFDEAIRLKSDFAEAHHGRGNTKADLGEYLPAIADYDEAIRLKPEDAAAYNDRGTAKAKLGRIAEARTDFEKAQELAKKAGNDKIVSLVEENLRKLENSEDV